MNRLLKSMIDELIDDFSIVVAFTDKRVWIHLNKMGPDGQKYFHSLFIKREDYSMITDDNPNPDDIDFLIDEGIVALHKKITEGQRNVASNQSS